MERTSWTDGRLDGVVRHVVIRFEEVGRRFDEVDHRFDRVEGDLKELRQMVLYLWGSMLIGFLVVIATVLVGGH